LKDTNFLFVNTSQLAVELGIGVFAFATKLRTKCCTKKRTKWAKSLVATGVLILAAAANGQASNEYPYPYSSSNPPPPGFVLAKKSPTFDYNYVPILNSVVVFVRFGNQAPRPIDIIPLFGRTWAGPKKNMWFGWPAVLLGKAAYLKEIRFRALP